MTTRKIIPAAAVVLAVAAAGCGSTTTDKTTTATKAAPISKPAKTSERAKVIACLESVGYSTESPAGDSTKMLRVKSGGGNLTAVMLFYKTPTAAARSAQEGQMDGLSSASIGVVEVSYFAKAADPNSAQSRVITDCVRQYGEAS